MEVAQSTPPIGERVARLEGAYDHLATKADVHAVRTDVQTVRTDVETVRTEVETVRTEGESGRSELRAEVRATRWMLGVLIAIASVGVAVVNILAALALRT